MTASTGPARMLRLRVSLREVEPAIWRILLIRESASLAQLHHAIQRAMGWTNSHLYEFEIGGQRVTDLETWEPFDQDDEAGDAATTRLREVKLQPGSRFTYLYDFGDNWLHDVTVEEIAPAPRGQLPALCIAGARACPPEDCGGAHGYFEFLEALHNPTHPEHESCRIWAGGAFDAEAFDLGRANAAR